MKNRPAAHHSDILLHPSQLQVRSSVPRAHGGKGLCRPLSIAFSVSHCHVRVLGGKWPQTSRVGIQLGPLTEQRLDFVFIVSCSVHYVLALLEATGRVLQSGSPPLATECCTGSFPTLCLQLLGGPRPGLWAWSGGSMCILERPGACNAPHKQGGRGDPGQTQ